MYGFGLNVITDMTIFLILSHGIQDKQVTSLQREVGSGSLLDLVKTDRSIL